MKCKYCKDFNEEKEDMQITQLEIGTDGYYNYECPIKYCPNCGTILEKYKIKQDNKHRFDDWFRLNRYIKFRR